MFILPEFWKWFFSVLGPSTFIGAILFFFLSSWRDRQRWAADNKKNEWRELIDRLQVGLAAMACKFDPIRTGDARDLMSDPDNAFGAGVRLLRDRIFIAEAIRKYKIEEKWTTVATYAESADAPREPHQRGAPTRTGYALKATAFHDDLVNVARLDLKLTSRFRLWWIRVSKKKLSGDG
jgi:hypothetical protein